MTRPQIKVNISAALVRRGLPTATGTAFLVYAGATGPTAPIRCLSAQDALDEAVPTGVAPWVGDCLELGAPEVIVVRAAAVDAAAVTQAEWGTALATLTEEFGPGQVFIPGVTTAAAHAALLAHSNTTSRCVLLDLPATAAASAAVTTGAGLAAATGADNAGLFAGWITLPGPAGITRNTPASVAAAGLVARGDTVTGHANHAPAGDQGRGAGVVPEGRDVTKAYTDDEVDDLY
ncbi:MAG: hypothetical protein WKF93_12405, partial [Acidimicrobiales bacterium]